MPLKGNTICPMSLRTPSCKVLNREVKVGSLLPYSWAPGAFCGPSMINSKSRGDKKWAGEREPKIIFSK